MPAEFMAMSKDIAQDFIQSILFVDDKAYLPVHDDHSFDVKPIIRESATKGLMATAFAPEYQGDLSIVVDIGRNADVVVLDWRIDINNTVPTAEANEEEDDVADIRGNFALQIIKSLTVENNVHVDQLKLIFIYTGEPNLNEIMAQLSESFPHFRQLDDFTLSFGGVRISIWAKESVEPRFVHMPEMIPRLKSYSGLLDEVPIEYAKISSGLLSNTCLSALTLLRNNTYKLLANFPPSLDPAFVAHRAMLPWPDDAGELLKEIICGELNSILTDAGISQRVTSNIIHDWVSSQVFVDTEITVKKGTAATPAVKITIDTAKRKFWQNEGYVALLSKELNIEGAPVLKKKEIETCERDLLKNHACTSFTPSDFTQVNADEKFSILTHHKRNYLSTAKNPSLTLGVMVKDNDRYLLCIQQKCASVRIPGGEQRKFLFLPMKLNEQSFDVLFKNDVQDYVRLSTCYKECYSLEIVEFAPFGDTGIVQAHKEEDGLYYFIGGPNNQIKFQWILDLKDAHGQRIANNFAANLARVGLDESEWLRRN